MADKEQELSEFILTFGAALADGSLFLTGVARELEDRDIPHTIIWERLGHVWKRYQWKNRTDAVGAYQDDGGTVALYMGCDGIIKVRSSLRGSREERVDVDQDAPSSLRPLSGLRIVGVDLYVCGMRRMVYKRPLNGQQWRRHDDGMRVPLADAQIAGLNSIDGTSDGGLWAVGMNGEIWSKEQSTWVRLDSPTNLDLFAVRQISDQTVIASGELGVLLVGRNAAWLEVEHDYHAETFTCIEHWNGRYFVCSDRGHLFELTIAPTPTLNSVSLEGNPSITWVTSAGPRIYFVGRASVVSLGADGYRFETPPADLFS